MITARKKWGFRIVVICLPVLLLMAGEGWLRWVGMGYETTFLIPSKEKPGLLRENPNFGLRFFPKEMLRAPLPLLVEPSKPPQTIRIVVLGESAARGEPEPAFSFPRMLQVMLESQHPDKRFEVINTAVTAINSHALRSIAQDVVPLKADFWVVYAGNNEVMGPFGPGSVFGSQSSSLTMVRLSLAARRLRIVQWLSDRAVSMGGQSVATSWEGLEMFTDKAIHPSDPRLEGVHKCFEKNLTDILTQAREAGAVPVLCTVGVNLRDSSPFASKSRPGISAEDVSRFNQELELAKKSIQTNNPAGGLEAFDRAAAIDGSHAELAFQRARLNALLDRKAEASKLYQQACDLDALAFRADSRINETIRKVAQDAGQAATLVDTAAALTQSSTNGISGSELFLEYVHLNFDGNYIVALETAKAIAARMGPAAPAADWPSLGAMQVRLGYTDSRRLEVLRNIRARLSQPPFNKQSTWTGQDRQLKDETSRLLNLARQTPHREAEKVIFATSIQSAPEDWMLRDLHARTLLMFNETAEATNEWQRVLNTIPHYYQAWLRLGAALNTPRSAAQAEAFLRRATELRPDVADGFRELGINLGLQKRYEEAEASFAKAIRLRRKSPDVEIAWGLMWVNANRPDRALDHYRRAVDLSPGDLNAKVSLCQLLISQNQHTEAVGHLRSIIQEHPSNVPTRHMLADAIAASGDSAGALAEVAAAVEANPTSLEARHRLAVEFVKRKRWGDAEVQFREMTQQKPQDPAIRYNLAKMFSDQGKKTEAIEQLQITLNTSPEHAPSQKLLQQLKEAKPEPR
ncbi:MAG: tetratricopeptide repeat protein [Verrucomicrobia bacterium]|nr:tetratricopeptide repeat protein [Verrucomicrobiota bacterium]